LNDTIIPSQIKHSVNNIRSATAQTGNLIDSLNEIVNNAKHGNGIIGSVLKDTMIIHNLKEAVYNVKKVSNNTDSLILNLNRTISGISENINNGNGVIHHLLKDAAFTNNIQLSLENIKKGTDGFNQNMEALKHNFLFRGYFRKLEKQKK
jgi:phospholipid/cholesterol/gamma-HCH transport system substrate-binding protein